MNKKIEELIKMHELKKIFLKYKEEANCGKDRSFEIEELSNYIESNFLELKNCVNIKTAYELGKIIENADISNLNLCQIKTNFVIYIYGMFMPMIGFIDKEIRNIVRHIKKIRKCIKRIEKHPFPTETMQCEHIDKKESEIEDLKVDIYNYEVLRQRVIEDYNSVVKYFKKEDLLGKQLKTIPFYKELKILFESEGHFKGDGTFKTSDTRIESFSNAISDYMLGYSVMISVNKEKVLIDKYEELSNELNHSMKESKLDKERAKLLLKFNETLD